MQTVKFVGVSLIAGGLNCFFLSVTYSSLLASLVCSLYCDIVGCMTPAAQMDFANSGGLF